jgi:hypothetical protein
MEANVPVSRKRKDAGKGKGAKERRAWRVEQRRLARLKQTLWRLRKLRRLGGLD